MLYQFWIYLPSLRVRAFRGGPGAAPAGADHGEPPAPRAHAPGHGQLAPARDAQAPHPQLHELRAGTAAAGFTGIYGSGECVLANF